VPENALHFSRVYALPRSIVWDALVDDALVDGWLAPAEIDPRLGGSYVLHWQGRTGIDRSDGVIVALVPRSRLRIETGNIGTVSFELIELAGGPRGTSTRLEVSIAVDTDPRLTASTVAYWRTNLEALEGLLRGHPVDWDRWDDDFGALWNSFHDEARAASGT
jgi:uncharacterized protein YndB with AHSA1/START domain